VEDLSGKVAVVTGAASGIGYGLAERFASEGMKVVLADIEAPALDDAAGRLRGQGFEVEQVTTDVSRWDQVEQLARRTLDRFGAVHVLCNNAGVVTSGPIWEQSLEDWQWVVGVDLWSVIHGVKAFVPLMLEQGGQAHVVNTASVAGLVGFAHLAPYTAAKFAVVGLSESLYHDLRAAGSGIGVSVLCPGVVPTGISRSARNRPGGADMSAGVPPPREPPATALTVGEVAAHVVDAIRSDRFWVVTHQPYLDVLRSRTLGMIDGAQPVAPPTF
jgi:NAD(P)-dependent dehydrogenase (short-subunit alcohol dehydrogenase family)